MTCNNNILGHFKTGLTIVICHD